MTEKTDRIHDYFRGIGNLHFLFSASYYLNIALLALLLLAAIITGYLILKSQSREPLVVFVDKRSGIATPVDFAAVDARGQRREDTEFHRFAREFVQNLFTFNRHTSRSNLEKVERVSSPEVKHAVISLLKEENRASLLRPGVQGLVTVSGSMITDQLPDVRVKVEFEHQIVGVPVPIKRRYLASLRIKTTLRSEANDFSGMYVTEFQLQKSIEE